MLLLELSVYLIIHVFHKRHKKQTKLMLLDQDSFRIFSAKHDAKSNTSTLTPDAKLEMSSNRQDNTDMVIT